MRPKIPWSKMVSRRTFLRRSAQVGGGLLAVGGMLGTYGLWETTQVQVDRQDIAVPNLPTAFAGKTLAVMTDIHLGPFVGIDFVHTAIRLANDLKPDLIALVGDFVHRGKQTEIQLPACLQALSELRAPLGVYAVPGNHDMANEGRLYHEAIVATPLIDLTNRSKEVSLDGESLWMAGVDDLWHGRPSLPFALAGIRARSAVILLCHNPDFMEEVPDARVGLALCGHTHGGQIYLPGLGSPWIPSKYGEKYRHGLVQGPKSQVFVSRGLGEAGIPLRMNSLPEINLITLRQG